VYVELNREALAAAGDFYSEHAQLGETLYHRYTEEQVQLLLEFVSRGRELSERRAAELEADLAKRVREGAAG
jgi:hypothetical protein